MHDDNNVHAGAGVRLRLWPGVVLGLLLVIARFVLPALAPATLVGDAPLAMLGMIGGVLLGAATIAWWLLFSRAPWLDRLLVLATIAVALAGTWLIVDPSVSNGMMGMMPLMFASPLIGLAIAFGALATRSASNTTRRVVMAIAIPLACGALSLVRTGGISGDGIADLHWRWTPTPEQRLLAARSDARVAPVAPVPPAPVAPVAPASVAPAAPMAPGVARVAPAPVAPAVTLVAPDVTPGVAPVAPEWPGFRGPSRDGVVRGLQIDTDWAKRPPVEIWRRPIGPGWSSFAVQGDLIYTQEQRGEDEIVACYRLSTGQPVWQHADKIRFWESNGGAGPRATPTLRDGWIYSMGATGLLNGLDAATGRLAWSRDTIADTGKEIPGWGIASSPIVIDDLVIVAVAGQLAAYDAVTGAPRWMGEPGGGGYSSPHFATIGGVPQVVLLRGARTISVAPATGTLLWEHRWDPAVSIVQPAVSPQGDVLIASGDAMGGTGIRRVSVVHGEGWSVEERWTSRALKPYLNDFVLDRDHAYGFDGSILACLDLQTGERRWKGGRYGHGQIVLLPDQNLLLVLSEDGELALVQASADRFQELARVPALNGKTWNHPALAGDVLLVRNGEEMAAFRLARAGS